LEALRRKSGLLDVPILRLLKLYQRRALKAWRDAAAWSLSREAESNLRRESQKADRALQKTLEDEREAKLRATLEEERRKEEEEARLARLDVFYERFRLYLMLRRMRKSYDEWVLERRCRKRYRKLYILMLSVLMKEIKVFQEVVKRYRTRYAPVDYNFLLSLGDSLGAEQKKDVAKRMNLSKNKGERL